VTPKRDADDDDGGTKRIPWGVISGITLAVVVVSFLAWYLMSPNTGSVSGLVTLDGTALAGAEVVFIREDAPAGPLLAATGTDGRYGLHGPTNAGIDVGTYKVVISKLVPKQATTAPPKVGGEAFADSSDTSEKINLVPMEYSNRETTSLRVVVTRGVNDVPFRLKSKL